MRRLDSHATLAVAVLALLAHPGVDAQETHPVVGSWEGVLGATSLTLVYHFEMGDVGALTGTWDSPDQGAFGIPLASVTFENDTLVAASNAPGAPTIRGTLSEDGTTLSVTFTQAATVIPMELTRREGEPSGPSRPQEPEPPFPYRIEDVVFSNVEASIELAGTLTLPEGDGPFPGAVLVTGSGTQDRNGALMAHKPFWVLADHLTRRGIAVLRYDDRGYAESGGDFATATSEDFASDALAAVAYLAGVETVAAERVGIIGHSEGGLVAPLAASRSRSVGYVVMLAGPGVTGIEILVEQGRLINAAAGTPPELTEMNTNIQMAVAAVAAAEPDPELAAPRMREAIRAQVEKLSPAMRAAVGDALGDQMVEQTVQQMNSPWMRNFVHYDPRLALEATGVPVLALNGGKDLQVSHEQNTPEIRAALERGGNPDATVRMLPGLNHLFQQATTGSPAEYYSIEETFNAEAMAIVSAWILERFGGCRPPRRPPPSARAPTALDAGARSPDIGRPPSTRPEHAGSCPVTASPPENGPHAPPCSRLRSPRSPRAPHPTRGAPIRWP